MYKSYFIEQEDNTQLYKCKYPKHFGINSPEKIHFSEKGDYFSVFTL